MGDGRCSDHLTGRVVHRRNGHGQLDETAVPCQPARFEARKRLALCDAGECRSDFLFFLLRHEHRGGTADDLLRRVAVQLARSGVPAQHDPVEGKADDRIPRRIDEVREVPVRPFQLLARRDVAENDGDAPRSPHFDVAHRVFDLERGAVLPPRGSFPRAPGGAALSVGCRVGDDVLDVLADQLFPRVAEDAECGGIAVFYEAVLVQGYDPVRRGFQKCAQPGLTRAERSGAFPHQRFQPFVRRAKLLLPPSFHGFPAQQHEEQHAAEQDERARGGDEHPQECPRGHGGLADGQPPVPDGLVLRRGDARDRPVQDVHERRHVLPHRDAQVDGGPDFGDHPHAADAQAVDRIGGGGKTAHVRIDLSDRQGLHAQLDVVLGYEGDLGMDPSQPFLEARAAHDGCPPALQIVEAADLGAPATRDQDLGELIQGRREVHERLPVRRARHADEDVDSAVADLVDHPADGGHRYDAQPDAESRFNEACVVSAHSHEHTICVHALQRGVAHLNSHAELGVGDEPVVLRIGQSFGKTSCLRPDGDGEHQKKQSHGERFRALHLQVLSVCHAVAGDLAWTPLRCYFRKVVSLRYDN